jgi:hypothetical protein
LAVVDAANSRVFGGWTLQIQIGSDVSGDFVSELSVNASKQGVEGCLGNPARLGVKEEKTVHPNRKKRV